MSSLMIRVCADADIPAIARIDAYHVSTGTASFEIKAPDEIAALSRILFTSTLSPESLTTRPRFACMSAWGSCRPAR